MKLSEEHRRWFQEAGEMAHQLVNTCVRGQQVRGDSISESRLLIAFIVYGELSIWCVIGDHVLSFTNVFIPANRLTRKSGILGKLLIQPDYNMVYAARFMIRMASLLPEACDLHQVGRDVEQVAVMLTQGRSDNFSSIFHS